MRAHENSNRTMLFLLGAALLSGACGSPAEPPAAAPPSSPPPSAAAAAPVADPNMLTLIPVGGHGAGVDLWIDGVLRGPLVDEVPVVLPPGRHVLEARRGSELVGSTTVDGHAGDIGPAFLSVAWEPLREPEPEDVRPRVPGRVEMPTAAVETGDGEFDPGVVVRTVGRHQAEVEDCYAIARGESPEAGGAMTYSFVVTERGDVEQVAIYAGTIGATGDECVANVVDELRFSPGPEGGPMTYEITFRFVPEP